MFAFFISAHGFGHASRASSIMAALRQKQPDCRLEVFSDIPTWLFEESVPGPVVCHPLKTDVGMVQKGPFEADLPKTLAALNQLLPFSQSLVQRLATELKERKCQTVVCDISPLGIAAAKEAGVPSILVENFTWDWIYEPYLKTHPDFGRYITGFQDLYAEVDVHVQTEPICRPKQGVIQLHPFSRSPKTDARATRTNLGISASTPMVLVTMGGVTTRHQFLDRLRKMPDITFVVPHDVPTIERQNNVIVLPHHSKFYHPDLVDAADLVIGKLGYSTLAEVGHAGKPFGYILREDSRESKVLEDYAARHLWGMPLPEASFPTCDWLEKVPALIDQATNKPAFPNDVNTVADIILSAASKDGVKSIPSLRFDPFTDRKSRDIRNQLSETFVTALAAEDPSSLHKKIDALMNSMPAAAYRNYIHDRAKRFDRVFHLAATQKITQVRKQAVLLWNEHLFFECHELLESIWHEVSGEERKALQGLIQAAGAYVHFGRGKPAAGSKLAAKAICNMVANKKHLYFIDNIDDLITELQTESFEPPKLIIAIQVEDRRLKDSK